MIKKLLGEWLSIRMKESKPPLPSDATIYILAFVDWADKQSESRVCPECGSDDWAIDDDNETITCAMCGERR